MKASKLKGINVPAALEQALTQEVQSAEQESTLSERALLVRFSIGRWYGSGADEQVIHELRETKNARGEIGSFTKRLMKRERLAEINRVTNDARKYHKMMTLPWGDSGARVLGVESFREYKEQMTKFEAGFFAAVGEFLKVYPKLVEQERENLGGLWKAEDYPSVDMMRDSFRFGLAVDPLPRTKDLRLKLSAEHATEIRREVEQRLHESLVGAVGEIYDRISEEVKDAKEKLDDPDARLQNRMFSGLQQIVALLPKLNIMRDPRLLVLGRELTKELVSVPIDSLRDSASLRKATSNKASQMLNAIAALKSANRYVDEGGEI